ncbi:FKBP-type peptidyl-prolyl cis-trans isomerase [Chitinophaga solisilvae]|uniref:Peptidyl-prolyl cis-trans isomerase n=1 Tax=Chitinophaga solisilvae TaxID=1233460 RepID=A0A433WD81_9BACT|nr:FKBP-type peptidyl-prolyl cis-trans isomerase [Chitinophaga solisilvae]NSL91081.1 hypothetical protein [Chitinophaga solisilvae]
MKLMLKIPVACLLLFMFACTKTNDSLELLSRQAGGPNSEIESYLFAHNEAALRDPSGIYYRILTPGDSLHFVKSNSVVYVNYLNKLTNGQIVSSSFDVTNFDGRELKDHIPGWQIGLTKISKGGKIRLFIPPVLAYGSMGVPDIIPPNAVLISDVELVDFK